LKGKGGETSNAEGDCWGRGGDNQRPQYCRPWKGRNNEVGFCDEELKVDEVNLGGREIRGMNDGVLEIIFMLRNLKKEKARDKLMRGNHRWKPK